MTGRRATAVLVALCLLLAATAVPATAQSDDGAFFDGLVSDEEGGGFAASVAIQITDLTSGLARWQEAMVSDEGNASQYAENFRLTFNQYNTSAEEYANERLTADTNHDVFAVEFTDRSDGNATVYIVSNGSSGTWNNTRALTQSEFDLTNRTVDQTVTLDWYQSRNAADEFETFAVEHAETGENLTATDRAEILASYGAPNSTMWNTTE